MRQILRIAAIAALVLGSTKLAHAQSKTFTFDDGTDDGWQTGFGTTDNNWTVANVGGSNRMFIPLGGFQVAGYSTGNTSDPFFQAMQAAAQNPAGYNVSYDYYIDTSTFTGPPTFLQIGTFVNTGSGYYVQDFPGSNKEVELSGAQLASGQVFTGHVSVNFAAVGFNIPTTPPETFYRLGLIENGDGSNVGVWFDNISVSPAPEPASLALFGLAAPMMLRRRRV